MISRLRGEAIAWDDESQSVEVALGGLVYEVRLPTICWRALEAKRPEDRKSTRLNSSHG